MAEIKQFSIIQAFTALWEIKDKEMASVSDFILNFIQMNKIGIKLIQEQEIWILEQNGCDFEIAVISLILISQRAVKAWIIENCFISAMVNLMILISKIFYTNMLRGFPF